jgi:hypothetical protein
MTCLRLLHRYLAPVAASFIALGCGSDPGDPSDSTLTLSTTTHDFGAMAVGGRSPVLVITVSNTGATRTGALTVALAGPTSGDFALRKDDCSGVRLSGGSTCVIEVEVIPTAAGLRQAVLTVTDSGGERVTAALSGTGSSSGLSLSPTIVTFGEAAVGQPGATKTVLVRNLGVIATGAITVAVTGGGAPAFEITRDLCSTTSLARGASCAVDVRFVPASEGSHAATLSATGVSAPSQSVQLIGLASGPTTLTATPPGSHSFAGQTVGTSSLGETFIIANTGTRPSGALAIELTGANTGDFQVSANGCYPTLAAGASCSVIVTFSPMAAGMRAASVRVFDPLGSNVTISVSGEGLPAPLPPAPLTMSPGSFAFPPTLIGAKVWQTVTVTNPGSAATGPLNTSVLVCDDYYYYGCYPSPSFSLEHDNCDGVGLAPGGSCTVSITFSPIFVGTDVAQFDVSAPGFTGTLALSGIGTGLHASSSGVTFAPTVVGAASASHTIIITNAGSGSTGTLATEISGFVFEIASNTCAGVALAPGGFCTISVRFKPTSPGGRYGSLGISGTPGGTIQIQLYGVGL